MLGFMPEKNFTEATTRASELDAAIEKAGKRDNLVACVVVCLKERSTEVHKALRGLEFEAVSFPGLKGTPAELIKEYRQKLAAIDKQLAQARRKAKKLAQDRIKLQILADHYRNLLSREKTRLSAPETEQTILLEGWVRYRDFDKLEKIVGQFSASTLMEVEPRDDEDIPVEIDNKPLIRPFEVVTRLYGMPQHFELDPTALLTPFFAIFFALCLTDAGYGLMIIAFAAYLLSKIQGDKKLIWLLLICSILTLGAGAMTGGWFGDAAQQLATAFGWTWLAEARAAVMWFDPLEEPMLFFKIAIGLGYLQIMVGICAAMVHNLIRKEFIAAICDQLTWVVMLNSIVLFIFGRKFGLSAQAAEIFGRIALVPAGIILFFSHRQGGLAGRIAMGAYNLFSTIFYMGDVLSYLRLMALGMVTGGLAMAINVMAKTASEVPYVGVILATIVLVGGHVFNAAISTLSAFVHTIRLQFVEFFPKFLIAGGKAFEPLSKEYKHVYITSKSN